MVLDTQPPRLSLNSTACRFLAAGAFSLLLHLFFCLLHHPALQQTDTLSNHTPAFPPLVYLGHQDAEGLSPEENKLYEWSEIASPTRLLYPDYLSGFSQFAFPSRIRTTFPEFKIFTIAHPALIGPERSETALTVVPLDMASLIYQQWNHYTPVEHEAMKTSPLATGVTWRFAGGRKIDNCPEVAVWQIEQIRSEQPDGHFNDEAMTVIEIIQDGLIPRLVLRQSSGWSRFDFLAIQALRETLRDPARLRQGDGSHAQNYRIQAIWHLQDEEEKP